MGGAVGMSRNGEKGRDGVDGYEQEWGGKWKPKAVGVRMGKMGRGRKGVWKEKVDMEKAGRGENRWHEEERSHAGKRG